METQPTMEMIFREVYSLKVELMKLTEEVRNENSEKLYTKKETAARLKVSIRTLSNYMREGKIAPTFHKRAVRFTEKEIDRYIQENTIK